MQSVIVVIAARAAVEEFLGRLERDGFLADRLEVPMLDQLEAVAPQGDSVWLFPLTLGGQNAALVAWWFGGAWRNLSFVTLPPAGDRAAELKSQLGLLAMAGEVEGWLTAQPQWHLVADPVNATEWEQLLRTGLNEPVQVIAPPAPAELAGRSAKRAAASVAKVNLQPPEFAARYREQFFDRLWLHGLGYAGLLYAIGLVIYFCAVAMGGVSSARGGGPGGGHQQRLHERHPAQGAAGRVAGAGAIEIRRAGLLATGGAGIAGQRHLAAVQPCGWQQAAPQRPGGRGGHAEAD